MDFLYFFICYTSSLLTEINSYVLVAANIDDFKDVLARKYFPVDYDDQIDTKQRSGHRHRYSEYDENSDQYDSESESDRRSYEYTTKAYKSLAIEVTEPPPPRYQIKNSAPVITLDELVEKVKQKLQAELIQRTSGNLRVIPANPVQAPPNVKQNEVQIKKPMVLTSADGNQNPIYQKNPVVMQEMKYDTKYAKQSRAETNSPIHAQPLPKQQHMHQNIASIWRPQNILPMKQEIPRKPTETPITNKVNYIPPLPPQPQMQQQQLSVQQQNLLQQQNILQQQTLLQLQNLIQQNLIKQGLVSNMQQVNMLPQNLQQQNFMQQQWQLKQQKKDETNLSVTTKTVPRTTTAVETPPAFETVDMVHSNDSYEDYVAPSREDELETEADVSQSQIGPDPKFRPTNKAHLDSLQVNEQDDDGQSLAKLPHAPVKSDEVIEPETAITTPNVAPAKRYKMGINLTTKPRYTLSSPNYYLNVNSTISEQYNFKEPIPEADREPENIKPIPNPPSSINGKILLV